MLTDSLSLSNLPIDGCFSTKDPLLEGKLDASEIVFCPLLQELHRQIARIIRI